LVVSLLFLVIIAFVANFVPACRPRLGSTYDAAAASMKMTPECFIKIPALASCALKAAAAIMNRWMDDHDATENIAKDLHIIYGLLGMRAQKDFTHDLYEDDTSTISQLYTDMCPSIGASICTLLQATAIIVILFTAVTLTTSIILLRLSPCMMPVARVHRFWPMYHRVAIINCLSSVGCGLVWLFGMCLPMRHFDSDTQLGISWIVMTSGAFFNSMSWLFSHTFINRTEPRGRHQQPVGPVPCIVSPPLPRDPHVVASPLPVQVDMHPLNLPVHRPLINPFDFDADDEFQARDLAPYEADFMEMQQARASILPAVAVRLIISQRAPSVLVAVFTSPIHLAASPAGSSSPSSSHTTATASSTCPQCASVSVIGSDFCHTCGFLLRTAPAAGAACTPAMPILASEAIDFDQEPGVQDQPTLADSPCAVEFEGVVLNPLPQVEG
jgi:hypothetical protein